MSILTGDRYAPLVSLMTSQKATAAWTAEWSRLSSSSAGCSSIAEALIEYPVMQIIPARTHTRCNT